MASFALGVYFHFMKTSPMEMIAECASVLPEFSSAWNALAADYDGAANVPACAALSRLAELAMGWALQEKRLAVALTLAIAEQNLAEAEVNHRPATRDLICAGFLETLQGLALTHPEIYADLEENMGPRCLGYWREIEHFWDGDALFAHPIAQLWLQMVRMVRWARARVRIMGVFHNIQGGGTE